ncbi:MAG: Appr-1-p processing protein [Nitrospira sp.]|nr:MAG: Appr-1-p processing protein [Nitrospira sp.]
MITNATGNLLQADTEALVNTVNCDGFMGKGIALQFKQAWPENFAVYAKACRAKDVRPGEMLIWESSRMVNPRYIINFPTKRHWREKSHIEDIQSGLRALVRDVRRLGIRSIAVPPLGCGNGGLNWQDVRPLIESAFAELPGIQVQLFSPSGAPEAKSMPVNTRRPSMTMSRALFVKVMHQYETLSYRLTLLEIQKLMYFLQEAGEPMRLRFEAGLYGPYAANLNKVLERMEGHLIRGYGDSQKYDTEIALLPDAVKEADAFLSEHPLPIARANRVSDLIQGFETPYGMELLSSVHWACNHGMPKATTAESAIESVHKWNERKSKMLRPEHIRIAHQRLRELAWIAR